MTAIFVSYRQADAKAWAISLRDDLAAVFGEDQVFLDKDALQVGNWREQIQHQLGRAKVVLVVIGPRWLTVADEQNRPRIHLDDDVHRQEVALALNQSGLTVIPVLVDEASMPRAEQLPQDLRKLSDQQARNSARAASSRKGAQFGCTCTSSTTTRWPRAAAAPQEPRVGPISRPLIART